ncbi:MAG TPA: hypothetical protein ENI85_13310 [Deltaproteobacteria bacterium]|nr:hypothetical protein [Deltaproteobacteria bacterium]
MAAWVTGGARGTDVTSFVADCELADFRRLLEVDVPGVFPGMQHGMKAMRRGEGRGGAILDLFVEVGVLRRGIRGSRLHARDHCEPGSSGSDRRSESGKEVKRPDRTGIGHRGAGSKHAWPTIHESAALNPLQNR